MLDSPRREVDQGAAHCTRVALLQDSEQRGAAGSSEASRQSTIWRRRWAGGAPDDGSALAGLDERLDGPAAATESVEVGLRRTHHDDAALRGELVVRQARDVGSGDPRDVGSQG